jgi:DNA-binding HxlR family transcriptional regulator
MSLLNNINKAFDHRIRLGIMSILMVNEHADFNNLKVLLEVTDGNLASHLKALEKDHFINVEKQFIGRKPNTRYSTTRQGRKAFKNHIAALERIIKHQNELSHKR